MTDPPFPPTDVSGVPVAGAWLARQLRRLPRAAAAPLPHAGAARAAPAHARAARAARAAHAAHAAHAAPSASPGHARGSTGLVAAYHGIYGSEDAVEFSGELL